MQFSSGAFSHNCSGGGGMQPPKSERMPPSPPLPPAPTPVDTNTVPRFRVCVNSVVSADDSLESLLAALRA